MDDFTSALYLGLHHAYHEIKPWRTLTSGVPAALREPSLNRTVAGAIAEMQGLERGVLAPSTLHLFWDLMGKQDKNSLLLADAGLYKIGSWGLERATCRGAKVQYFKHHQVQNLAQLLKKRSSARPSNIYILTNGWCPHCGRPAPLPAYLALAREHRAYLLIDDTQALGILGKNPNNSMPYGKGGGGLLRWFGLQGPDIITICSLAKGFGVPLSVLSGSSHFIKSFEQLSETRVHCSPVSAAHVQAALQALSENQEKGPLLRQKLLNNVILLKKLLLWSGIPSLGGYFPMQSLALPGAGQPRAMHRQLAEMNIGTLLLQPHQQKAVSLSVCISASHHEAQIRRLVAALSQARQELHRGLAQRKASIRSCSYLKEYHYVPYMQKYAAAEP